MRKEVSLSAEVSARTKNAELRLTVGDGGPWMPELLVKFAENKAKIVVWNPFADAAPQRKEDGYEWGRWMVLIESKLVDTKEDEDDA